MAGILDNPVSANPVLQMNPLANTGGILGGGGSIGQIKVYRAGNESGQSGKTFYSTAPEGAQPYASHGAQVQESTIAPRNMFDTIGNIQHSRLYDQFLQETGHPARRGENGLPFWTAEPDLKQWLNARGVFPDAIKFDENTGVPSIAVYQQ